MEPLRGTNFNLSVIRESEKGYTQLGRVFHSWTGASVAARVCPLLAMFWTEFAIKVRDRKSNREGYNGTASTPLKIWSASLRPRKSLDLRSSSLLSIFLPHRQRVEVQWSARDRRGRDKLCSWICTVVPFRSTTGPPFHPIFSRADSTQMAEHSRKVLLGFEAAGHCDIQYTPIRRAQHLFRTLYSVAQYKLVRRLACRL